MQMLVAAKAAVLAGGGGAFVVRVAFAPPPPRPATIASGATGTSDGALPRGASLAVACPPSTTAAMACAHVARRLGLRGGNGNGEGIDDDVEAPYAACYGLYEALGARCRRRLADHERLAARHLRTAANYIHPTPRWRVPSSVQHK